MGMKACTPMRCLVRLVVEYRPAPQETGGAFYRRLLRSLPANLPTEGGPDDELSVTWLDGEVCVGLPEIVSYLRGKERSSGSRCATECSRDLLEILAALEARARAELRNRT